MHASVEVFPNQGTAVVQYEVFVCQNRSLINCTETQGADPDVEASTGHTALTWAAVCGFDLVAAELLLGDSNNKNTKSVISALGSVEDAIDAVTRTTAVEGKTALHNAAFNGNSGVVVLLLDRLRDLLLRDRLVNSLRECTREVCRDACGREKANGKRGRYTIPYLSHGEELRERFHFTHGQISFMFRDEPHMPKVLLEDVRVNTCKSVVSVHVASSLLPKTFFVPSSSRRAHV